MGQQPSHPLPGAKLRVIGAGLPRTGTSSLTLALTTLLRAPAYHGGTQATLGPESEIRSWITLLKHFPARSASDKTLIQSILRERLDGYAAVTDSPCNGLVEELVEMYPDAIVICTVRDVDAWVKSMDTVASASTLSFLNIILFWLPTMRYFPAYIVALRKQWVTLYGKPEPVTREHWEKHVEYLERVVPKERLVWYDVKEGWEPLCRVLGKQVPEGEFPRVNDGRAIEEMAGRMVRRGLVRWGIVLGTVGVGIGAWWWVW